MHFGTRVRFKSVQAARTAALIAWATVMSGDRIGAIGYGPGLNTEVKPVGGMRGALRCLRALAEWDAIARAEIAANPVAAVPLAQALQRAQRIARPGTQIVLLTDGFDADEAAEPILSRLAEHCDIAAVLLRDPLEHRAPPPARYALVEEGRRTLLDFSVARTRARWPQLFEERRVAFSDMLRCRALNRVVLDTPDEPEDVLRDLLGFDARRKKKLGAA
ncbi:MAG: hypothetical protein E6K53_04445 [Gammaproteobacteria bacterium]|nr:MAG: hypothetical protein E6K53_04445 [Gammaproteobacteria bacterium]